MEPRSSAPAVALRALLGQHPEALVAAIGNDGLFVPVPDDVPLTRHREVHARSALDVVAPVDRVAVIEAWDGARADGAARVRVRLDTDVDRAVVLHFFDTRDDYGVFFGVIVADGGMDADVGLRPVTPVAPRVAKVHKNLTATILDVDDAATRMFGMAASDLAGQRSLDLIHPDDHERAIESWMQMLSAPGEGHRVRLRHRCGDGGWKWLEITNFNHVDDPSRGYVLAEVLDISDEMAAHEALRAREQMLRRLTESLPTGVLQFDCDGAVRYSNERVRHILGVSGGTADEQFANLVGADRARFSLALSEALSDGVDRDLEILARLPASGVERSCLVNIRALTAEDGSATGAVVCLNDVTEASRLREELARQASVDALTGCHNRRATIAALEQALATCRDVAVVFVDIDEFKSVNDRYGHAAGDDLLAAIGTRLRRVVRADDVAGRIGGDEFLVVSPGIGSVDSALLLAERVSGAIAQPVSTPGGVLLVPAASVGVAWTPAGRDTADELVARADAEMYGVKHHRARLRVATDRRRADGA